MLRPRLPLVLGLAAALSCADETPAPGPKPPPGPAPGPWDDVAVTGRVDITGLKGPVDVVRDKYGTVHIHATSVEDALRVQGYQVARDRTAQLELIRRTATGRMAEVFGDTIPSLIDSDIAMRNVGLARTAKAMLAQASPEIRAWVAAYADGISQFNARVVTGDEELPAGMIGLSQKAFAPWTPEDVVAVARLQAFNLGYDAEGEIALTELVEAAHAKMNDAATDPALKSRAGILPAIVRFAPLEAVAPLDRFPDDVDATKSARPRAHAPRPLAPAASREVLAATRAYRDAIANVRSLVGDRRLGTTGSNNWIVGPSRSKSGHAMLASDPHLTLSAPAVFWMVHVAVDSPNPADRLDFTGLSFPGLPGIILGFNANVAWGATTADYDVTDVYAETIKDGKAVRGTGSAEIKTVRETIAIAGGRTLEYDVPIVDGHGPIIPTINPDHTIAPVGATALSVKWTGHQPTNDLAAVFGLLRAKTVDEARRALQDVAVGAQNWVVADTNGDIFYTSHALIPKRDPRAFTDWDGTKFQGNLPCLVLPSDGTAEWTGKFLEDRYIPHVKNPPEGFLATANTEQIQALLGDGYPTSGTLPNDANEPIYLACWHDPGFRLKRIQDRIRTHVGGMTLDDMASIQADARSASGGLLAPKLSAAIDSAEKEKLDASATGPLKDLVDSTRYTDAYTHDAVLELRRLLDTWAAHDYDAASGVSADDDKPVSDTTEADDSKATLLFNAWMAQMFHVVLDDELEVLGTLGGLDWRRVLIGLMTNDSAAVLFDDLRTPAVVETRDERAITALLDAIDLLKARLGESRDAWRWGRLHTLRFQALIPLWHTLSIPAVPDDVFPDGFPRHGDGYNVDVGAYPLPPAFRFGDAGADGGADGGADPKTLSFAYSHGPTQRLVVEMDPAGPIAHNALPGGNVWDSRDPHFRDEAERWRRNQNRPVPFAVRDVIDAAEGRVVYDSKR